jgi:integrase
MARIKLTPGRISDFTTDKAQAFLWDSESPGLAVRCTGKAKAFVYQGKLSGKDIRITIGDVGTWGLKEARHEASRLGKLTDEGIDPREQKRERIAAAEAKKEGERRQDVTVSDAWVAYLEARKPRWSARNYKDHIDLASLGGVPKKRGDGFMAPGPLAELMPLKLSDLSPERVGAWLEKENATRPTRAALAYRLLRAFIRWAAGMPEFKTAANVESVGSRVARDNLQRVRAKEGDSLQREQLPLWFKAVRELGDPVSCAFLQVLLLTGARREEIAALKWADVDFQWKSLSIADKVEEGGRIIPLTPFVASLLSGLPRRNEWVFSSAAKKSKTGRVSDFRPRHVKALAIAGLPHVSLHGLRRSFGTLSEWVECPVGVVAQIQGHKPSAIAEKHYRRRPLDLLRMWHERIEAWILEQAGIEQPKEEQAGLRLVKA